MGEDDIIYRCPINVQRIIRTSISNLAQLYALRGDVERQMVPKIISPPEAVLLVNSLIKDCKLPNFREED